MANHDASECEKELKGVLSKHSLERDKYEVSERKVYFVHLDADNESLCDEHGNKKVSETYTISSDDGACCKARAIAIAIAIERHGQKPLRQG